MDKSHHLHHESSLLILCNVYSNHFLKVLVTLILLNIFIKKLNCLDGISITRLGKIEELKQQDYSGKRVLKIIYQLIRI